MAISEVFDDHATEAELQGAAIELALMTNRWLVHHTRPARRLDESWQTPIQGHPGFVDVVFASEHYGMVVFAEFKSAKGRVGASQVLWAKTLKSVCLMLPEPRIFYRLWRPKDWPDIERVIGSGRMILR